MEFEAFKSHASRLPGKDRVLPILLRDISDVDLRHLDAEAKQRYHELRAIQMERWTDLPSLNECGKNNTLRRAADAIKTRIYDLANTSTPEKAATAGKVVPPKQSKERPAPAEMIPPVSGDYYVPSQAQGGCTLRLAVSGLSEVETRHGTIVFSIDSMTIQTTLKGAKITQENPEFSHGWEGPIAKVTRLQTGPFQSALSVEAVSTVIRGEPLAGRGEAGHVWLFDFERLEEREVTITGKVDVSRKAIQVNEAESDLEPSPDRIKRRENIRKITDVLMQKFFKDARHLEPWSDD